MKYLKPALVLALVLVSVASSILAWRQYQELVVLRIATRENTNAADIARIRELEQLNRELRDRLAAHDPSIDEAAASHATTPVERPRGRDGAAARANREAARGGPAGRRALLDNPQVQALRAVQQKAMIDQRYAALFRQLNLPPEKLDQFKTLLADRQATMTDAMAVAREQGVDPRRNPEEFRQLMSATQADLDRSMKSAIGDTAFAQYQAYEQSAPQRSVVNQLERRLSYSADPLSPAQADQLVQILVASSPSTGTTTATDSSAFTDFGGARGGGWGGRGGPGGPAGEGASAAITASAVAQAQSVLTPAQAEAFQQLQQQQQARQQLRQLVEEQVRVPRRNATPTNGQSSAPAPAGKSGG